MEDPDSTDIGTLETVYRNAVYIVEAPGKVIALRVGRRSSVLDELLRRQEQDTWAVITAYNPGSRILSLDENLQRDRELESALERLGLRRFRFRGTDPEKQWPDEEGYFVMGIDRATASEIGNKFGQNAILFGSSGEPVQLVMLV